jgi:YegS/Rv2252/BmrU family lipid kinase
MVSLVDDAVGRGDVVVSVGGDGMLSSLAGLVSARGGTFGVIPAGRGNDFARMLGLPESPENQARLLLEGSVRSVDLLAVTGVSGERRVVAGSVYAGVDARAAEIVDRATWLPRKLQYPYAALRALATYQPGRYRVAVDGIEHEYAAATVVVANSAYYGKGMRIAPPASVEDGVLDVVVIEAAGRIALMRSLPKVYDGGHVELPEVTLLSGKQVELRGSSRGPIPVGADGEPLGALPSLASEPAIVEVVPGALPVIS